MENTEGSEGTPTKISDSAYSNSCGNSQSQRSGSSKSRHSGSNSSGSSGYGGKASSSLTKSNDVDGQASSKRKDKKKKNKCQNASSAIQELAALSTSISRNQITERGDEEPSTPVTDPVPSPEIVVETILKEVILPVPECPVPKEQNVVPGESEGPSLLAIAPLPLPSTADDVRAVLPCEAMDEQQQPLTIDCSSPLRIPPNVPLSINTKPNITAPILGHHSKSPPSTDGFSCVVSMCDGVVLYTNNHNLTESLGYPKDMWIGRSFIDFIHPKDRSLFANQTTSGVAMTLGEPIIPHKKDLPRTTLFCRIRKYRGLKSFAGITNFGVRDREVSYVPYKLTLSFRDTNEFENREMYMVISASAVTSPFGEGKIKTAHFISRHKANGIISHIEPVAPLGFLPQDVIGHSIFDFYHPEDMPYLKEIYETLSRTEKPFRSKPFRLCTQNGDYLTIEAEWSTFVNPWSRKIEFITCNNEIIEAPANTDVFDIPKFKIHQILSEEILKKSKVIKEEILTGLSELIVKSSETNKQVISKRCKDLATFMEHLLEDTAQSEEELRLEVPDEISLSERDSVMLGEISPHHDYCDSKSSTEAPPSYSQMNYNENLQRFFESRPRTTIPDLSCPQQKITIPDIHLLEPVQVDTQGKYNSPMQLASPESGASGCSETFEKYCVRPLYHPVPRYICEVNKIPLGSDYKPTHLTEELLSKHNSVMEKLMVKKHREARSVSKASERDKGEKRDKKNEHTKPCINVIPNPMETYDGRPEHGLKRSRPMMWDTEVDHKVSKMPTPEVNPVLQMHLLTQPSPVTAAAASSNVIMSGACLNSMTTPTTMHKPLEQLIAGHPGVVNLWPPFSVTMTPMQSTPQAVAGPSYQNTGNIQYPGVYPAVYLISPQQPQIPLELSAIPKSSPYPVPYVMYPPTVFSSQAFIYPPVAMGYQPMTLNTNPITTQVSPVPPTATNIKPLGLPFSNYQQACQLAASSVDTNGVGMAMQGELRHFSEINNSKPPNTTLNTQESQDASLEVESGTAMENLASASMKRPFQQLVTPQSKKKILKNGTVSSHMTTDDNDEEASSYSSFYSSFLKTENSNSTGDVDSAGEPSNSTSTFKDKNSSIADDRSCTTNEDKTKRVLMWRQAGSHNLTNHHTRSKKTPKILNGEKNIQEIKKNMPTNNVPPPWLDAVCVTSELVYRYQVTAKKLEDVLKSDLNSLNSINQPSLVNEQLSQLYMELQLEGLSENLALDEGITSSSSEEEQSLPEKKNREYAKLVMIYEDDAPMPPPNLQ